mgnify:CR=1 FL=1
MKKSLKVICVALILVFMEVQGAFALDPQGYGANLPF